MYQKLFKLISRKLMIKIDVFVQDKNWKKYISNPNRYLKNKIKLINSSFKFIQNKKINFSILLAGNKEVRALNKKFRNKDKITDVLSFPFYKKEDIKKLKKKNIYLGDIILNFYKINKKNFKRDFNRLWIHGFLHLLGFNHVRNRDYKKMLKEENRIYQSVISKIY